MPKLRHLADFIIGKKHYTTPLRDTLKSDFLIFRFVEHRGEGMWSLDAGNLNAVLSSIREPFGRIWEIICIGCWQSEPCEEIACGLHGVLPLKDDIWDVFVGIHLTINA